LAMGKMEPCPQCGAQNSVLRTTCYQCGAALTRDRAAGGPTPAVPSTQAAPGAPQGGQPSGAAPAAGRRPGTAALSVVPGGLRRVRDSAVFFRQFTGLVQAGFTVVLALEHAASQGPWRYRAAARAMSRHTSAGGKLSDAMEAHPHLFHAWQIGLVSAGETGGLLPQVLDQIATALESEYRMRLEILVRLRPLFVAYIPVVLLLLPLALAFTSGPPGGGNWTRLGLVQAYAYWLPRSSLPALAALIGLVMWWQFSSQAPGFRAAVQRIGMRLPLIGALSRNAAMTRFTETLSALWQAGVSAPQALDVSAQACGNVVLAGRLMAAAPALERGLPLTDALRRAGGLPDHLMQLLRAGEVSGTMPDSIEHMAKYYRADLERSLRSLPRLVAFLAWLALLPVILWVIWTLFQTYVHFRFTAPLDELERSVP